MTSLVAFPVYIAPDWHLIDKKLQSVNPAAVGVSLKYIDEIHTRTSTYFTLEVDFSLMLCFNHFLRENPVLQGATNLGRGLVNFIFPFSSPKQGRDDADGSTPNDNVSLLCTTWY